MSVQERKISEETLLRTYLQQKCDKKLKKKIEGEEKTKEEEKKKRATQLKKKDQKHEQECRELEKTSRPSQMRQIDYSWIARQLQVGTSLGRCHNLVEFQI